MNKSNSFKKNYNNSNNSYNNNNSNKNNNNNNIRNNIINNNNIKYSNNNNNNYSNNNNNNYSNNNNNNYSNNNSYINKNNNNNISNNYNRYNNNYSNNNHNSYKNYNTNDNRNDTNNNNNKNNSNICQNSFYKNISNDSPNTNSKFNSCDFHPWIRKNSPTNIYTGYVKLHYEILDFVNFISLTPEETRKRNYTFEKIKELVKSKHPEWKIKLYGSFATGLSLPDSDIDILILPNESQKSKSKIDAVLYELLELFKQSQLFSYQEIIAAKVPIIKATFKETQIKIDLSTFKKNGYKAKKEMNEALKKFPEMKPLILIIKYILRQRDLNEVYKGGASSFLIFSLVYFFICNQRKYELQCYNEEEEYPIITLGNLLVGFFSTYSFNFNYKELGISIRYGTFLFPRNSRNSKNILMLENYQDITQDIGCRCFKYGKIIELFKSCRDYLLFPEKSPVVSYLYPIILKNDSLIERAKMLRDNNN